jgi:hypothetical protein
LSRSHEGDTTLAVRRHPRLGGARVSRHTAATVDSWISTARDLLDDWLTNSEPRETNDLVQRVLLPDGHWHRQRVHHPHLHTRRQTTRWAPIRDADPRQRGRRVLYGSAPCHASTIPPPIRTLCLGVQHAVALQLARALSPTLASATWLLPGPITLASDERRAFGYKMS